MLDRFRRLLDTWSASDAATPGVPRSGTEDPLAFAAAALLMEVARSDDSIDPRERARIVGAIGTRFALRPDEAEALTRRAEAATDGAAHHYDYVRVIVDRCPPDQRVAIIEMLWEVVYADAVLGPLEASLLRRIGGLLYVSDVERGAARKRVLRRLGLPEDTGL